MQVIRQHLDQKKPLIAFFVTLTILVKRKTLFEFVNLVLYVAALIVFMEDLLGRQGSKLVWTVTPGLLGEKTFVEHTEFGGGSIGKI